MKTVFAFAGYIAYQPRSALTKLIVEALKDGYPYQLDKESIEEYVQENSPPTENYTPEQISRALKSMASMKPSRRAFTKEKFAGEFYYALHPSLGKAI